MTSRIRRLTRTSQVGYLIVGVYDETDSQTCYGVYMDERDALNELYRMQVQRDHDTGYRSLEALVIQTVPLFGKLDWEGGL